MYFLGPFTKVAKYSSPTGKGIYVKPHNDANPNGWGDPRRNPETGEKIDPGTPNGPHERTLIYKKDGEWVGSSTKYRQKSGNITWWGPLIDPNSEAKGRYVLSYLGPKLRYFREIDFTYGSTSEHNEIYYAGNYAAIAPAPVLGACMQTISETDPLTGLPADQVYIYVAVYQGGEDRFYRRKWNFAVIAPYRFTDAIREAQMELHDPETNPNGWQLIGTFARPTDQHYPPETPWFFNESGTEALNLRRRKITFDPGGGVDIEEECFERLVVSIDEDFASVENLGNEPQMVYNEEIEKTHPLYSSVDIEGHPHDWQEDHVRVTINMTGAQFVMGDYIGDERYWGKLKFDMRRYQAQYYTEGIDNPTYEVIYNGQTQNISNAGMRLGPRWHNFFEYGYNDPTYIPEQADHEASVWIGLNELIKLYFGPETNDEQFFIDVHLLNSGTSDEWAGNPREENNPFLFFHQFYTRHPRGLFDIRHFALFSHDLHKYGLRQGGAVDLTYKYKDYLYSNENLSGEAYYNADKTDTQSIVNGWEIALMETWPDEIAQVISRLTYEGAWSPDNHQAELSAPGSKTFYVGDASTDFSKDWPVVNDILFGEESECKGNGCVTDTKEICFSLEIPHDINEGQYVLVSDHKPAGKPEDVVGFGDKFYPVGAC